jgi:hypothetical protein
MKVTKIIGQRCKQGVAILLMVLIPGLTFMQVLAHKRQQKEVKRFLERSVGLALSEDLFLPETEEYAHLKKGTEIVVGGNKYDVLKVSKVQGGYWVKAFNDKIERALENQIAMQCERGSGGSSKAIPIWFDKLQWALVDDEESPKMPLILSESLFDSHNAGLQKGIRKVSVPPPQG